MVQKLGGICSKPLNLGHTNTMNPEKVREVRIRNLNLPATKVVGFLRTKGFLIHLRAELALVPQDFHGQTP